MSTATLTSLAMLKVNIDQGEDYLEYLRPFVLQVLVDRNPELVTDQIVTDYIREQFGLEIPQRTVQIVIKRLSRNYPLKKVKGVYQITGSLPDPGLAIKQREAELHIDAVVSGLIEFSKGSSKVISDPENAIIAICAFLSEFDILCLRAYLRRTTIPSLEGTHNTDIVLVSEYVISLQKSDPERFDSFLRVVQGHMLANALLCPDLRSSPSTYKGVTFYFDTPLLIQRLGVEGEAKQAATTELIRLLVSSGGRGCRVLALPQ